MKKAKECADDACVILRDDKRSRHLVIRRSDLLCSKNDVVKAGSLATYTGAGDRTARFRGTVLMTGTPSTSSCEL